MAFAPRSHGEWRARTVPPCVLVRRTSFAFGLLRAATIEMLPVEPDAGTAKEEFATRSIRILQIERTRRGYDLQPARPLIGRRVLGGHFRRRDQAQDRLVGRAAHLFQFAVGTADIEIGAD